MTNSNASSVNRQRGAGLILVLIALAVGSTLITPTLNYVYTGLRETPIGEELLLEQYTADAAVEYGLWQLKYNVDGLTDQLDPENPSANTSISVNGADVPITTEITQSPLGDDWPFPVPSSQTGIHLTTALVIAPPYFSDDGQTAYFPHVIYMYNSGTSAVQMKAIFQQLDPSFTYVPGSFNEANADLTETYVDGRWELYFDFGQPLPKLDAGEATFMSFVASTTEEIGENTYNTSGYVAYAAFGSNMKDTFEGEYGLGTIGACYDITITVGSYTVRVNTGITEEGEIVILSYQIE